MKLEEIASEASKLSEKERAALASSLLHGLKKPIHDVSDDDLSDRIHEADNNPDVWLTFDQLVAGLKPRGR
jgi:hypothetical protein